MELSFYLEELESRIEYLYQQQFKSWKVLQVDTNVVKVLEQRSIPLTPTDGDDYDLVSSTRDLKVEQIAIGIRWDIRQSEFHKKLPYFKVAYPNTTVNEFTIVKDPGEARRILRGKRNSSGQLYTNRKLRRMRISVLKACAQSHTMVTLTTYIAASVAVDQKTKTIYSHHNDHAMPSFMYIAADHYLKNIL
jgi:hypothetical protein